MRVSRLSCPHKMNTQKSDDFGGNPVLKSDSMGHTIRFCWRPRADDGPTLNVL